MELEHLFNYLGWFYGNRIKQKRKNENAIVLEQNEIGTLNSKWGGNKRNNNEKSVEIK